MNKSTNKRTNYYYFIMSIFLFVVIIFPIATVFTEAVISDGRLDFRKAAETIGSLENLTTIKNSLILGILVVIVATLIATPLALLLVKTSYAKYKWLDIILMIPFMTPPYISSMGWILFMQKRGLFQQIFPFTGNLSEKFFSLGGLVLVMSFHVFPFMTSILKNAILNIGVNLEESAAVCGAGYLYRMKKVLLPLLTGNYAIGFLLVFVKTLSEYGTPATLGQRIGFYVFTTDIHRYATISPIDFGKASSLSSILVSICLIMWYIQNHVTAQNTFHLVGGKGQRERIYNKNKLTIILGGCYIGFVILVSIGIPYFSVVVTSLIKLRGYGMASGNYTLDHYKELFSASTQGLSAIKTSIFLAVMSATIASIIGTFIVISIQKAKRWKKFIEMETLIPEMIPNIVLVIGMMLFWNKIYQIIPLYNTIGFMVLVYVVMFIPYTIQYVSGSLMQVSDNLMAAGRVCGAGFFYTLRKITLPLVMKGVLSGWMMIFIIVFRELVAASLISPPNVMTVSTYIVSEFNQGSVSLGMCMAVVCVLISTSTLIFLNQWIDKSKK